MTKRAGKRKRRTHGATVPPVTTAVTTVTEATAPGDGSQAGHEAAPAVPPDQTALMQSLGGPMEGSYFWPELSQDTLAAMAGREGDSAQERARKVALLDEGRKRIWEFRTEIQAVTNGYPIPEQLKARMVFEAAKAMTNTNLGARERLLANKLLLEMDKANRAPGDLPDQLPANSTTTNIQVNVNKGEGSATVQEVVRELLGMPEVLDAIDLYEFKGDDGEDYAS